MAFDVTIGGANSNSYVTESEADDYFENRLHSDLWADFQQKEQALITATKLLERYIVWNCTRKSLSQALMFPAFNAYDRHGNLISNSIIPVQVKEATYELAYSILEEDRTLENDLSGISSIKVGSLAISAASTDRKDVIPPVVYQILQNIGSSQKSNSAWVSLGRG